MKTAFNIYHDGEIRKWVLHLIVDASNWLINNYRIDAQIDVYIRACGQFETEDGRPCLGAFFTSKRKPKIYVAAWYPFWIKDGTIEDREDACLQILDIFFHEFNHYQQLLRGLAQTHRGMWPRVRGMMRRFLDEPALNKTTTNRPRCCKKTTRTTRVPKKPAKAKVRRKLCPI